MSVRWYHIMFSYCVDNKLVDISDVHEVVWPYATSSTNYNQTDN